MEEKLDAIFKQMMAEHPLLEDTRKTSNKYQSLTRIIVGSGIFATFIGIISGNIYYAFGSLGGLILLTIGTHFLLMKRLDYNHYFDEIKLKYIQSVLDINEHWALEFMDKPAPETALKAGNLFNPDMAVYEKIISKNYIKGTNNNYHINIMEIDLQDKKYKNSVVAFGWRPSTLVTFDYPLSIGTSSIMLFPNSYLTDTNQDHNLYKVFPARGKKLNIQDADLNKKYSAYILRPHDSEPVTIEHFKEILLKIDNTYYKEKWKFISLHQNKIAILIFGQKLLNADVTKSLTTTNPFIKIYNEVVRVLNIITIFDLHSSQKK